MKSIVQPLVQRWRQESSSGAIAPAAAPHDPRRPFRLWMTGSLAVVMAAMLPLRGASEAERSHAMRVLRHSPFDVSETLQRIELAARDRGLSVLAKVAGSPPVLVLASSIGGTLVVMNTANSRPAMPLSLMVSAAVGGGADVLVAAAERDSDASDWSELPSSVADDLRALPGLLERALG
ncbi:MAG: hypothetical protein H7Y61_03155 [Rhizobiales bacterium]|nr:hypothetical protein [Rhizobacter sp.]